MTKKTKTILIITLFLGYLAMPIGIELFFQEVEFIPYDIGPELRNRDVTYFKPTNMGIPRSSAINGEYYIEGQTLEWYILDPEADEGYTTDLFELRAIGSIAEVWVQVDMSYPTNDPRDTPVINDTQALEALSEFEDNIYGKICSYFGIPDFHDGMEAELGDLYVEEFGRTVILVSNIRDENYYDDKYPYITVGFYWGVFEQAFDRNIISIDSYRWDLYIDIFMATVAHEFQHLVHDDYLPDDDLFMNEGCSMYAEPLCGFDLAYGDIEAYLATPDNSLTEWEDQGGINTLADYGQALLWTIYLSDRFGENFLSYFFQNTVGGIEGINEALAHFTEDTTFDNVFHDWRLANLLHTDTIGGGKYNYASIDWSQIDPDITRIYTVRRAFFDNKYGTDFGETSSYLNDKTGVYKLGSYGSDYIKLANIRDRFNPQFLFDGDDIAEYRVWNLVDQDGDGDREWYSTVAGAQKDLLLSAEVDLTPYGANPILSFDTYYDIEESWDFGFVQVSTDNGQTWISLENEYTTYIIDEGGYPAINESLPGLSGSSGGWISMEFDLSSYAEQTIMLGFRYMTDWATEELGWYIDNIAIGTEIIENGDNINLFVGPDPEETDFIVTLIGVNVIDGVETFTDELTLELDDASEETLETISLNDFVYTSGGYVLLVVSTTKGLADYNFSVQRA
jgi:hypothetical protein